ncbi:MAG: carboxypeptidase regulatory-like domain-containing protein [Patescibacteria group bacterium]|jgi:hypothetical protein
MVFTKERRADPVRRSNILVAGVLLAVCAVAVFGIARVVYAAPAELFITPSSSTVSPGTQFSAEVVVHTGGQAINAAQATVTFPSSLLEIDSVSQEGIFSYWAVGPTSSQAGGTVEFGGGLPNPGFNGNAGKILTMTFTARTTGTAQICATDGEVLANDGLGTDVLGSSGCTTVHIVQLPSAPAVTSPTHPDQQEWYAQTDAVFQWTASADVTEFSYALDALPTTLPDDISETQLKEAAFSALADGTWTFHIKGKNDAGWSDTAHFRVRIDTVPPVITGTLVGDTLTTDQTPDIEIEASDSGSGIDRIIRAIDNQQASVVPFTDRGRITLPELSIGAHRIVLTAIDRAGNSMQSTVSVEIRTATIIERIVDSVPDIVNTITQPITDIVQDLRNDEGVVSTTEDVVQPISRAATAISVATAVSTLPISLGNLLLSLLRFLYVFFSPILLRKGKHAWGRVIDGLTRKPIRGVSVRIFASEFHKLKEVQTTDIFGRFGFLVEPGMYSISAEKQGYHFPSTLLRDEDVYAGGDITVTETNKSKINVTIVLDPDTQFVSHRKLIVRRMLDRMLLVFDRVNWPLLVVSISVSLWSAVVVPGTLNTLILTLNALLVVLKTIRSRKALRSYGTITDEVTHAPLGLAVVRIFNAQTSAVVATRITNTQGRFSALVPPGAYYLIVTKPPYSVVKTRVYTLSRAEVLAIDVKMTKPPMNQGPTAPPAPPRIPPMPVQPSVPPPPSPASQSGTESATHMSVHPSQPPIVPPVSSTIASASDNDRTSPV